jgi:hypothetical protein
MLVLVFLTRCPSLEGEVIRIDVEDRCFLRNKCMGSEEP